MIKDILRGLLNNNQNEGYDNYEKYPQKKDENRRARPPRIGLLIIVLLLLATISNNLFSVRLDEYVIVREFGEIVKVIDTAGLNMKIPFIQSTTSLPKKALLYDVPPAEINTLDKKRILVDYYAMWEITDPKVMIESLRTVEGAENRLGDIMYSNIRTELGKLNYDEIINPKKNTRNAIDDSIRNKVNNVLEGNNLGIRLKDVRMKRTDLPAVNEESVYLRMISERESTAQEYLSQGDAEALKIMAETDRLVSETLAKAEAEAKIIEAEGDKEAGRIYNEAYGQDPEFFNLYRSLESYKTTIDDETVIVFPVNSPYLKYLTGK